MLNFWNWTNDRLPKVAHMFMKLFFQLGCFLALSTRKLHLNVLKPNKNVSVYITECPDVGQALGDLIQRFQLYFSAVTAFCLRFLSLFFISGWKQESGRIPRPRDYTK